jgi:hypothetical protein
MPPSVLEPTIPASERPQPHALDRAATAIGICYGYYLHNASPPSVTNYVVRDLGWNLFSFSRNSFV